MEWSEMDGWEWDGEARLAGYRLTRRIVTNRANRRVTAALSVETLAGLSGDQGGFHSTAETAPNESSAAGRYINDVWNTAQYLENDDIQVARILSEYAFRLTQELGPSNPGRDRVFESHTNIVIRNFIQRSTESSFGHSFDPSKDVDIIEAYYKMFKEKEDIENLNAQAALDGLAPADEDPEYQAWRTEKLRRFHAISNILINAAMSLAPLADLAYLHQQLFSTAMEADSTGDMVVTKTTIATITMLHNDVEQLLNAYTPIDDNEDFFLVRFLRRFGISNVLKKPRAQKLLNLCLETVQKSAEHLHREDADKAYVMNMHQCDLLVQCLRRTQHALANIDNSQLLDLDPILLFRELLQTLLDAQMHIEASCISTSQWPRAAFEQGDMIGTFSKLLYDVEWHTSLLQSMLEGNARGFRFKCVNQLSAEDETALLTAMMKDEESLKQRLRCVKVADRTNQGLADQLLNQMETPSPDLAFLNPNDFDHKGAGLIGQGSFGAVVLTNLLDSECAMKVFKGGLGTEVQLALEMEMNAVKKLGHHPHLVRVFCYSKTDEACYLIMERLQMDLAKVLRLKKENGHGLSVVEAVDLILQIGEGLKYIHNKGVAHRDIKPGNILINLTDPSSKNLSRICSVKIADFGITKTKEAIITGSHHTRNTGTSLYMAPEVIKLGKDDRGKARFNPAKADVFSFAIVCSEILTGETPYVGLNPRQMKEQVKAGTLRPNLPTKCPSRLASLIKKCWAGNYDERPLIAEICRELRYIKALLLMYTDRVIRTLT